MDAFITRKRQLPDTNDDYLPPSPQSSAFQPSSPPTKKAKTNTPRSATASKNPRPKKAASKRATQPGHCSLDKKTFGDKKKNRLASEKYAVQSMSFKIEMDIPFFKGFFGDKGIEITPEIYDESTPVVVAEMGNKEAGEIFGVSNIKNGNRYETVHLRRMCIVLYPGKKVATAWISA